MEDYQAAFLARHKDTEILDSSARKVAAMHFGGVTIECLLKSMIFANLPENAAPEWKTNHNNPGHSIRNPGHDFNRALQAIPNLYPRIQEFPELIDNFQLVQNPNQKSFINMRYDSIEPKYPDYEKWKSAYSLRIWLENQSR
jgi:hypothetical protein